MYLSVKKVKPLDNYQLLLIFENDENRVLDMKPYLTHGIFKELIDVELFNSVKVAFDSIEWSNQADLDPELLYKKSIPV